MLKGLTGCQKEQHAPSGEQRNIEWEFPKIRGPQYYGPQNGRVLEKWTSQMEPSICRNSQMSCQTNPLAEGRTVKGTASAFSRARVAGMLFGEYSLLVE